MRITSRFHVRRSVWVTSVAAAGLSIAVGVSIAAANPETPPPVEQVLAARAAAEPTAVTVPGGRIAETSVRGLVLVHQIVALGRPQRTQPQVVIRPLDSQTTDAKGTNLVAMSQLGDFSIPEAALRAYKNAAATVAQTDPSCQMPWTLLAGIGRVESDNGQYGGSVLGTDGIPRPAIIGIPLNGHGVAAVPDTDNGRWDGDKVWDRAVGPMQFIPSTWATAGRDGDGDGIANPNDINDAALAAADYLCPSSGSILGDAAMRAAILSYNDSDYYVALVMAFEKGYRTGVFSIPSPPPPPSTGTGHKHRHHKHAGKTAGADKGKKPGKGTKSGKGSKPTSSGGTTPGGSSGKGGKGGGSKPGGGTPTPAPTPTSPPPSSPPPSSPPPSPSPSSTPTDILLACGTGWCLNGQVLDFGSPEKLNAKAAYNFDGDKRLESNAQELNGLVASGASVTITVQDNTTPALVMAINGHTY